jgi:hypothetical protein
MHTAPSQISRARGLGLIPIVALATLAGGAARAADEVKPGRVKMVDNSREAGIQDCVRRAAKAVCDEDLGGFLGCFTEKERSRIRRKTALLFVTHTLELEIVDSHVLGEAKGRAELAVNYQVRLTDQSHGVVSILDLTAEDGRWLIAGEQVQTVSRDPRDDRSASSAGRVFRFGGGGDAVLGAGPEDFLPRDIGRAPGRGCANGRCGM